MIDLDTSQVQRLQAALSTLKARIGEPSNFTEMLGPAMQEQTRFRIYSEKADPQGEAWKPWSESYRKTRNPAIHSLLIDTRAMVNTIEWHASGDEISVGSARPYAGYVDAVRQFVGLSPANMSELETIAIQILESFVHEAAGSV